MQQRPERPRSYKSSTPNPKPAPSTKVADLLRNIDGKSYFKEFKQSLHQIIQNYKPDGKRAFATETKDKQMSKQPLRKTLTTKALACDTKPGLSNRPGDWIKSKSTKSLSKASTDTNLGNSLKATRQSQGHLNKNIIPTSKHTIDSLSRNLLDMKRLPYKNGLSSKKKIGMAPSDRPTVKISTPMFIKAVSKKSTKKNEKERNLDEYVTKVKEPNEETETVKLLRSSITFDRDTFNTENDSYYMNELHTALGEPGTLSAHTEQIFKAHFNQTIQSLMFFKNLQLKGYTHNGKEVKLGPKDPSRKTLIFDLDETLIHCNADQNGPADVRVPVTFPNGDSIWAGINVRPFAREILVELAKHFEIVVFTASHSCYANPVVDYLDEEKVVKARLFRENCSQITDGLYTKDLSVFVDRELKDIILVDNAVYSFVMQLGNGIPIIPFYEDKNDKELLKLRNFLIKFKDMDDVRERISEHFKWQNFLRYAFEPDQLLRKLSK